jgi:hypothetical protein
LTAIFGHRSTFAIEYSLACDHGGVWMFGNARYWCGGREIGNFSEQTSLRDLLFLLEEMRRDIGKRQNPRFWNMPATDMFRLVDAGLFGKCDIAPVNLSMDEQWARHNITPSVDVFDDWKVFVVESDTGARAVFSKSPYTGVESVEMNAGEVDAALESTVMALGEIYEQEAAAVKKP